MELANNLEKTNEQNNVNTVDIKQEAKPKTPRMIEQDVAKGIAILLVMALHTLSLGRGVYSTLSGIFGFIMPFFFFMSGYNHRVGRYKYKDIVLKRTKQIIIPFLIYSFIVTVFAGAYYMIKEDYTFKQVLFSYLNLILTKPLATLVGIEASGGVRSVLVPFWFIQMLFSSTLIFYAIVDYALEKGSRLISIVFGLIAISMVFAHFDFKLPFYLSEAPSVAAILLLGAFFGQKKLLSSENKLLFIIINGVVAYSVFLVLASLFQGSGFIAGGNLWDDKVHEWAVLLSVAFAICGTYPFVHFCRLFKYTGFFGKIIAWIGNHSLYYLFLHWVVQVYWRGILNIERTSSSSEKGDIRTLYLLALEILTTTLIILGIEYGKKLIKKIKNSKKTS